MWPFSTSTPAPETENVPPASAPAPSSTPAPQVESPLGEEESPDSKDADVRRLTRWPNQRAGMPIALRYPLVALTCFTLGFGSGSYLGATKAGLRYRAENAHRMPKTTSGWFLYQKSKNYHSLLGGVSQGVKMGGILTAWASLFVITEEVVDQARMGMLARGDDDIVLGQRDAASTVVAGMTAAGVYSWKQHMDKFTAARTARSALKYSLMFGLLQDVLATATGSRPAYVDWMARHTFWPRPVLDVE